ncbi:hypothetical protein GIB67_022224 [Kingdonia uniflora]|uniref:Uncharacterized protein n=1 Tax=Kingdonia uniflora TaxID=39325 RepID=A0A7J7M6Y0_9MAGN|nr:hypothetical protein GIB67_022224 [Kingdonia uniflora]
MDQEPQRFSEDGLEQHIHVNHIAPALLSLLLLPSLLRAPSARIVNVNSVLMFLKVLASKLLDQKKASIQCITVHPGAVGTKIASCERSKKHLSFVFSPAQGARSVLFCATSPDVGENMVNGLRYYSCDCKRSKVSPKALDNEACLDVWEKTMDVLELNEDELIRVIIN